MVAPSGSAPIKRNNASGSCSARSLKAVSYGLLSGLLAFISKNGSIKQILPPNHAEAVQIAFPNLLQRPRVRTLQEGVINLLVHQQPIETIRAEIFAIKFMQLDGDLHAHQDGFKAAAVGDDN